MKQHHILTTGISLLTNFARDHHLPIEQALRHRQAIAAFLHADPCKACAEINSLDKRTGFLTTSKKALAVTLVFTNTSMGKTAASIIEKELKARRVTVHKLPIKGVDAPAGNWTPGLPPQQCAQATSRSSRYAKRIRAYVDAAAQQCAKALADLRQHVTDHIARLRRNHPDLDIQLNCTGGFKAECAVLYELRRTLRLPVYYLHETFRVAVELP